MAKIKANGYQLLKGKKPGGNSKWWMCALINEGNKATDCWAGVHRLAGPLNRCAMLLIGKAGKRRKAVRPRFTSTIVMDVLAERFGCDTPGTSKRW